MEPSYKPEFITCAIHEWKNLLAIDEVKQIVLNSLKWLVQENRVTIYCFVIMPNHVHILWHIQDAIPREKVQGAFFSFTAHAFLKYLKENNPGLQQEFVVKKNDRKHQFWRRHALYKECFSSKFIRQKIDYIHNNPCQEKWKLVAVPEEYEFSSASFYYTGKTKYSWLTHIGNI